MSKFLHKLKEPLLTRREMVAKCGAGLAAIIAEGKAPAAIIRSAIGAREGICSGAVPYDAKVEYLQANNYGASPSTAVNVIDTGIIPDIDTDVWVCDAQWVSFGNTAGCWGTTGNRFAFGRGSTSWNDWYFGIGSANNRTSVAYDFNRHIFKLDGPNRTLTVDDATYTGSGNVTTGAYSVAIFNRNGNNGPTYRQDTNNSRCYSSKYYRNGRLIQHLIPVRVGSVGYLYDKVNPHSGPDKNGLLGNLGPGAFTFGADVT